MVKLSALIITYNEERNISRCLDSLLGVVDEVVVVDSFSKDKTKEIALSKGARFVEHAFEGHIEQKNWAISQATYPHVLSLDADEALSPELRQSILQVKQNWQCEAYAMNRLTNYCGHWIRHGGWYPDTKARLWDSRKGQWGGDNPHDKFELFDPSASLGFLEGDILHYSYYSRQEHQERTSKYGEIGAQALLKRKAKGLFLKQFTNPPLKFFKSYISKLGFLDGSDGLFIAQQAFRETWLKYHLAWQKKA
jgi:glycosyltransferase involved in cell wall biosynthesis